MSVTAQKVQTTIEHRCERCRSAVTLPEWVTGQEGAERCKFQCPVCDREAEVDISHYPMTRVRVVVNDYERIADGKGGY